MTSRTSVLLGGRQAYSERRYYRVLAAIQQLTDSGEALSVSGVARTARVDRAFLYRHPDLLGLVRGVGPVIRPHCGCSCLRAGAADIERLQEEIERLHELTRTRN